MWSSAAGGSATRISRSSAWNLRRYFWLPRLGLRGIFRLTLFKDVFIVSGNGVGGGSLGYANTLYRARPAFFADPQWDGLADWEGELRPHYDTAERMLGVTEYEGMTPADELLREYAAEIGVSETFKPTRVGIFFGEPGKQVTDPYFDGEGPPRSGCIRCGSCMVGCRHGAKNTLVKNYLWFAERLGAEVLPERQAIEIRPLEAADGSDGLRGDHGAPRRLAATRGAHPDGRRRGGRRRARWGRTSCSPTASTAGPCRASRSGSGTWCGPIRSRSRPSPLPTTAATSPARWRSRPASTPTPTPTSRWSPTGGPATR